MREIISILLILAVSFSCQNVNNEKKTASLRIGTNKSLIRVNKNDLQDVKLVLSRGAFHYDSFELKGNELRYFPSDSQILSDHPEYMNESGVILEDSIVLNIINKLIENNIFQYDSVYPSREIDSMGNVMEFTCNSSLELELKIYDKNIQIKCYDYQAGCPEIITSLENELIKLHGKNLKRIILPG